MPDEKKPVEPEIALITVDPDTIEIREKSELVYVLVRDAAKVLWKDNLKKHWNEGIIKSLLKYGLKDKPVFDKTLGAIQHGNGRVWALHMMEQSGEYQDQIPRGINLGPNGEWVMQIDVGIDARDLYEAIAYAKDANNLTVADGDNIGDVMNLWEIGSVDQIKFLYEHDSLPVSISEQQAEFIFEIMGAYQQVENPEIATNGGTDDLGTTKIQVTLTDYGVAESVLNGVKELLQKMNVKAEIDVI